MQQRDKCNFVGQSICVHPSTGFPRLLKDQIQGLYRTSQDIFQQNSRTKKLKNNRSLLFNSRTGTHFY